jgi:hypothetical protein
METDGGSSSNPRCDTGVFYDRGDGDRRICALGPYSFRGVLALFYFSGLAVGEVSRSGLSHDFVEPSRSKTNKVQCAGWAFLL